MKRNNKTKLEAKMVGTKPALKSSKVDDSSKGKKPLYQTDLAKAQATLKKSKDRYTFGKSSSKQIPDQLIRALKKLRDTDLLQELFSK